MDLADKAPIDPKPSETESDRAAEPDTLSAQQDEIAFLENRISFFISDYKKKRNKSRDLSNTVKILSLGLGALITLLIGLKPFLDAGLAPYLSAITLLLSVCLTALGAWEAFADHRWKWIRYRATLSTLYTIQDDFHFRQKSRPAISAGDVKGFYAQLRTAVHETNQEWMAQRGNAISGDNKGSNA
jgi:hypothetical protein